jgi:hypothetical protein
VAEEPAHRREHVDPDQRTPLITEIKWGLGVFVVSGAVAVALFVVILARLGWYAF